MKELKSLRPGQWRYSHEGRTYSIIDMTAWPENKPEPEYSHFTELMTEAYAPFIYELAEQTSEGIRIIGRYRSLEAAQSGIKLSGVRASIRSWLRGFKRS